MGNLYASDDEDNSDDDAQDPLIHDEPQGCIPLNHFYGFPSPHPQTLPDPDGGVPMAMPCSSGTAGAQGGSGSQSPPDPISRPTFLAEDKPWRNTTEAAIINLLQHQGNAHFVALVLQIREDLGQDTVLRLEQHLIDSTTSLAQTTGMEVPNGSENKVDDFIHRVLWDGHARGLWIRKDNKWHVKP